MERDLAPIVEVLEENTSDHDPSLPSGGKTSRRVSRRSSLFRRFLAFFCCSHATTMSMSRRCSIQIVDSDSSSPTSEGSSPTAQVGLISVISLSDKLYLSPSGEKISEQDKSSIQSPGFEGSDSILAEDSRPQSYVLADESSLGETVSEQDRGNIPSPASEENISGPGSEESDTTESEDSTSQGYVTADEFTLGNTISEHERRGMPSPVSEKSDSTQYEDSTSHGYVIISDDLTLSETISEHDRGNIPYPAHEGHDFIEYEDSASDIYIAANELTQDSFPQLPSSPLSIESTFPPQNSAPGTLGRTFQQKQTAIRRAGGLRNVSNM